VPGAMLAVAVIVATAAAGCGQAAKTGGGSTPAGSTGTTAPTTIAPPTTQARKTAADGLAGYFAAARLADARIHHAAALINAEIGAAGAPGFSQATKDAVAAADPLAAAAAIPAGLRPDLMWAVLRVQNDLESRWYAFRPGTDGVLSPPGDERSDLMRCLGLGAPAAARFPADLRAARRLAATLPPVRHVPARSRAAANLAVRLRLIVLANSGCENCGGYLYARLPRVVWRPSTAGDTTFDGTADGILFQARYHPGSGWDVLLNAC
jgi:hypothetical protein